MTCIGHGLNTLPELYKLESINKSSKLFYPSIKQVLALEIATIKDATNHGWQAVIGMPSAALNGHLSDQAQHLWYTFTHLAFAVIVPFALIYPSSASTAAHALQLYETSPQASTGVIATVKLWSARIPFSLKAMTMCVGLIALGFLASQVAYTQPLQEKYDREKGRSGSLQTALLAVGGIYVVMSTLAIAVFLIGWKALSDSNKILERNKEIIDELRKSHKARAP
ncbi:MAG: hypothetical protein Q8K75_10935 [Chlamydiales bacterium]|nr:hypothetical protein [Chlamydiales bacterium]